MSKLFLLLTIILLSSCGRKDKDGSDLSPSQSGNTQYLLNELSRLSGERRYFEMRDLLKNSKLAYNNRYILFYRACAKCVFDETDSSIMLFDKFLSSIQNDHKNYIITAYSYQSFNYVKKLEKRKAAEILDEFLTKYPDVLPKDDRSIVLNNRNMQMFGDRAGTKVYRKSSELEMKLIDRDPKRISVRIKVNGREGDFLLDTGAEVNVIKESRIKKFGIRESGDTLFTSTPKGRKAGRSGVAGSLVLGNLIVTNAPFLIYADSVQPINDLDGTIGYPLMRLLGKIVIDFKDMEIRSADKELSPANQNLCYSGNGPVINASTGRNTLSFSFDTGAYWTLLHSTKYTTSGQIEFVPVDDSTTGIHKYRIAPRMDLEVSGKKFELKNIRLITSPLSHTKVLDGVFGVEALKQYNRIYIDFKNLIIEFE